MMPAAATVAPPRTTPDLPGRSLLLALRRLIVEAGLACIGYTLLMTASRSGGRSGGALGDGTYVDAQGNPTPYPPGQIDLTLHPSPVVYVAIAVLFFWSIRHVLRTAADEASARRIFNRVGLIIVAVALGSLVIGMVWFLMSPVTGWPAEDLWIAPLPFGTVTAHTTPLTP
jgi:hypothetical protein